MNVYSTSIDLLVRQKAEFFASDKDNLFPQLLVVSFKADFALGREFYALTDNEIRLAFVTLCFSFSTAAILQQILA